VANGKAAFATLLRRVLDEHGVSNRDLARRLAKKNATSKQVENLRGQVGRWRKGQNTPRPATVARIAAAIGEPPDMLLAALPSTPTDDVAELRAEVAELRTELRELRELLLRREPRKDAA
jgi:transcriptional regulator with XRE-family HTH domain